MQSCLFLEHSRAILPLLDRQEGGEGGSAALPQEVQYDGHLWGYHSGG